MATIGTMTAYEAGKEIANAPIEAFTEEAPNSVIVLLQVTESSAPLIEAIERSKQLQQVYLAVGGFQMTFNTVIVTSMDISPPKLPPGTTPRQAKITFTYESTQPGAP